MSDNHQPESVCEWQPARFVFSPFPHNTDDVQDDNIRRTVGTIVYVHPSVEKRCRDCGSEVYAIMVENLPIDHKRNIGRSPHICSSYVLTD